MRQTRCSRNLHACLTAVWSSSPFLHACVIHFGVFLACQVHSPHRSCQKIRVDPFRPCSFLREGPPERFSAVSLRWHGTSSREAERIRYCLSAPTAAAAAADDDDEKRRAPVHERTSHHWMRKTGFMTSADDDDAAGEGRDRIPHQPLDECEREDWRAPPHTVNTGV